MIPASQAGKVYLVGAGPGDPGLLTLRGRECLRFAEVVFYDYLVNPQILHHAPALAQRVCLGRHGRGRIWSQSEINARLIEAAQSGKCVVRLKGGDTSVFAHTAEETEALLDAGISFEIVPGITAALAAASYIGIPLTHRASASAVALVTGQQRDDDDGPLADLDYAGLARFPGTLVFYMGVTSARQWSTALLAAGMAPDTPAALVRRATWPDQSVVRCTLADVSHQMSKRKLRPPVVVILGPVAQLAPQASWFCSRPLFGQRVLVTRPVAQSQNLVEMLQEQGAEVLLQPAIEVAPPKDWQPIDNALARIDEFQWLVFSSANGVRFFFDRLLGQGGDVRRVGHTRLAAIGPGTADELLQYHLRADLHPAQYRAEALAAALAPLAAGRQFLLARASRGREVLAQELRRAGGLVEEVVCYQSEEVQQADPEILARLARGEIHWVTVTSSAIARSLSTLFGEALQQARLVSISPITSATLRELGFPPQAEATEYTMPGVVRAILAAQPLHTAPTE